MQIKFHVQFKRDIHKLRKAGWKMDPFEKFLDVIFQDTWPLPHQYEAHMLKGNLEGIWDIHLRQNWIVFFRKDDDVITLLRTGTHAYLGI